MLFAWSSQSHSVTLFANSNQRHSVRYMLSPIKVSRYLLGPVRDIVSRYLLGTVRDIVSHYLLGPVRDRVSRYLLGPVRDKVMFKKQLSARFDMLSSSQLCDVNI